MNVNMCVWLVGILCICACVYVNGVLRSLLCLNCLCGLLLLLLHVDAVAVVVVAVVVHVRICLCIFSL